MYKITQDDIDYCNWIGRKICRRWGCEYDEDKRQDVMENICIAAKTYDPLKYNTKFITYAKSFVMRGISKTFLVYQPNRNTPEKSCPFFQNKTVNTEFLDIQSNRSLESEYIKFDLVEKTLSSMPPKIREAVFQRFYNDKSYRALSTELGIKKYSICSKVRNWMVKKKLTGNNKDVPVEDLVDSLIKKKRKSQWGKLPSEYREEESARWA
ncbi:MAG TPA: hypothetical protein VMW44_00790 [Candidatus Bathyarchaeia archaeon]|nr:hypothetical protein [Candidatus Bathyarchaeia archaeon]